MSESGSRIDAAAKAFRELAQRGLVECSWDDASENSREHYRRDARTVLAAADEAESSIAEKLAERLSHLAIYAASLAKGYSESFAAQVLRSVGEAEAVLAEFEKLRASAPVENRGK